jgi:hypothetical protein
MASPLNLVSFQGISNYTSDPTNLNYTKSMFNAGATGSVSGAKFYYRPSGLNYEKNNADHPHLAGAADAGTGTRFTNDVYDTSINSIIDYTSHFNSMKLIPADFAYLKNVGVYPNNRLIVARRYASPVYNDLTIVTQSPVSTVVSWIPPEQDTFFDISFGEEWIDENSGFKDLLDKLTHEFTNKAVGDVLPVPIPMGGFTVGFQAAVLQKLGVNISPSNLPDGNANIIRSAKRRKVMEDGASLKCDISVKVIVEYEQKWINGVDPTIVFLDIINNALRFGTSYSQFLINGQLSGKLKEFFDDFRTGNWDAAIKLIVQAVIDAIDIVKDKILGFMTQAVDSTKQPSTTTTPGPLGGLTNPVQQAGNSQLGDFLLGSLKKAATNIGSAIFSKYKHQLNAIIAGMTGESSVPWHLTLGNPKKPFFSSADMLCDEVKLSFGNTLSFNDLPSTIRMEFNLKNARPLGMQEIFDRFNIGGGRTYLPPLTQYETPAFTVTANSLANKAS